MECCIPISMDPPKLHMIPVFFFYLYLNFSTNQMKNQKQHTNLHNVTLTTINTQTTWSLFSSSLNKWVSHLPFSSILFSSWKKPRTLVNKSLVLTQIRVNNDHVVGLGGFSSEISRDSEQVSPDTHGYQKRKKSKKKRESHMHDLGLGGLWRCWVLLSFSMHMVP